MNVLIVEDSKNMQSALTDLFKTLGVGGRVAITGRETEATERLLKNKDQSSLVTVDLMLEEGSGINFIARAKQTPGRAHVIVLSGYVSPAIKTRCLELGADAVFNKTEVSEFAEYVTSVWGR